MTPAGREMDGMTEEEWVAFEALASVCNGEPGMCALDPSIIQAAHREIVALRKVMEEILNRTDVAFANATYVGKDYTLADLRAALLAAKER